MKNYTQDKTFNTYRYYDDFKTSAIDELRIRKVLNLIGKNKFVLDIGCGDGLIMGRIKSTGNKVIGVEIAENAIRKARKKGFKVYDLSLNSDWAKDITEKFNVVFCGEIIEHIIDTDRFLTNVRKVLCKNGKLVITTPNVATLGRRIMLLFGQNPFLETTRRMTDAGHLHYFTHQSLKQLLEENGFRLTHDTSLVVNFCASGKIYSELLAQFVPTLGNNIIVCAQKTR